MMNESDQLNKPLMCPRCGCGAFHLMMCGAEIRAIYCASCWFTLGYEELQALEDAIE